ncbi:hypothetical protein VUJ46_05450 [Chryseobacterium sp. MYb264]|uniref:beta strand repeat-containing protein n=1 Tax=Chryseobacterium sp. MYb264 TaxID=2745153 RepID=UPI002E12E045|nr:hypothetical protein VUJ46_05450 [Chryseobacterium sp. MYb264]
MKKHKYIPLFLLMFGTYQLKAQEKPYSSMIFRSQIFDNTRKPVKNENLKVEVELLTKDKVWYSEYQQINTNDEGFVFIQVGKGASIVGSFNEVPFSNQEISLKIKYKILNGSGKSSGDYIELQSTDLYAVPYAFHALTAGSVRGNSNVGQSSGSNDPDPRDDSNSTLASKGNTWSVYGNKYIGMRNGFLGTSDSSPLHFKTNNKTRITITPEGKINFFGDINMSNTNTVNVSNLVTENLTAGNATVNNLVSQTGVISSTTQSTSPDTGAFIVKGGIGIKKNLHVGENLVVAQKTNLSGNLQVNGISQFLDKAEFDKQLKVNDLTESNVLNEGSLITAGGASVAKNLNVGAHTRIAGNVTANQNLEIGQNIKVNGAENATNKDHGALIVENGGLGVEKDIISGGSIRANSNISSDNNLDVAHISNLNTLNVAGNTNIQGVTKIVNNTFSSDPTQGAFVVQGGVGIGENLNIAQNATVKGALTASQLAVNNTLQVNGDAEAVDQNSGALIVAEGGLGVEKSIYSGKNITAVQHITANGNINALQNANVGQNLSVAAGTTTNSLNVNTTSTLGGITNITNATHSTNPSTGAFVVQGGVGIGENLNVAQNVNVTGVLTTSHLAANNTIQVNGDADAVDQNSGALIVTEGGLGVEKNIYSGKNITAVQHITANGNINALQNASVGQNLSVAAGTTTNSLNVNTTSTLGGITNITNATHSTNPSTGAFVVQGGVGIGENLNVAQNVNVTGVLTTNHLAVNHTIQVNGDADAVDQNSGALIVTEGGLGVEKNIYSGKNITAVQHITANGNINALQNAIVGQNLSVAAGTTTNSLNVNTTSTLGGITHITNATHSTDPLTGALLVAGGLGVKENINTGQNLNVGENLNVAKNASITGTLTANSLSLNNLLKINGTAEAVDQNSGALIVAEGGLGVEKSIYSGKNITAVQHITANGNVNALQNTNVGKNLSVAANTTTNSLNVTTTSTLSGITHITNATHSTNPSTGALTVAGGLGVSENINVGEDLTVSKNTNLNGNLYTNKLSTFNDNATFNKGVEIKSLGDNDNDKALKVEGGAIVGKRLHVMSTLNQPYGDFTNSALKVDGGAIVKGNLSVLGQVFAQNATVNTLTPLSVDTFTYYNNPYQRQQLNNKGFGPDHLFDSYTLRINAVDQGIAIKVNKHAQSNNGIHPEGSSFATSGNNFISFWDNTGRMVGRIEGQTEAEVKNSAGYQHQLEYIGWLAKDIAYLTTIRGIKMNFKDITEKMKAAKAKQVAGAGGQTTVPTPGTVIATALVQGLTEEDVELARAIITHGDEIASMAENIVRNGDELVKAQKQAQDMLDNWGVTYSSHAGDYAEYLELENLDDKDKILPSTIVGVTGGKISFNTENSDKVMVVSKNPAVVGKLPEHGAKHRFKPVAFMGQVPVFVLNKAKIGDYIVPSGNNDGYAIAKSADLMKIDDYKSIIGIAWEESNASKLINVAVGINTNNVTDFIKKQQTEIDLLESRITQIEKFLGKKSEISLAEPIPVDNSNSQILNIISKNTLMNEHLDRIVKSVTESLRIKNFNLLKNKELYIENEINNYFGGIFFDKQFSNQLTAQEKEVFSEYFKIVVDQVKARLM